jgi:hypothetical protein
VTLGADGPPEHAVNAKAAVIVSNELLTHIP